MLKQLTRLLLISSLSLGGIVSSNLVLHDSVILNDIVQPSTMKDIMKEFTNDGFLSRFMTTDILIDSPGGEVHSEHMLTNLKEFKERNTVGRVYGMAASAASMIFLNTKHRIMHKDSRILIHEVRLMSDNIILTYSDLKSILENGTLAPGSVMHTTEENDKQFVEAVKQQLGKHLKEIVDRMHDTMEKDIADLMRLTGKDRKWVTTNLLISNVDNEITAQKALKLGLIHEIEG